MLPSLPFLLPLLLLRPAAAVFSDEAWHIDYHYALLGEPQDATTFFHQPDPTSRASLIYTLSREGVVGAVNPRDGSLVWRQLLFSNTSASDRSFLRAGDRQAVVVSGRGDRVAAWNAADGRLAWDLKVDGRLEDVEVLELPDGNAASGAKDALALSGGDNAAVRRIDGASGAVKWQHRIDGGDLPYQLSASATDIFAILLHKTMLGYVKIRVLTLDPLTGHKTDEYTLSSDGELSTADTIVSVGANSASPIIAWTDASHSVLKVNIIGTKAIASFDIEKHDGRAVERVRVHAPYHTNSLAHFLVQYETASSHWADVFHVDLKKNRVDKAYSLPKVSGGGAFSTSTSDANVYFTRVTRDRVTTVSSVSHGVLGQWTIGGFGVDAAADEHVEPVRAVSEVSIKGDAVSAIRTAVLLSTGDWALLREGNAVWQRPEVLAGTVSVAFGTPSAAEAFVHELEVEAHSGVVHAYIHRLLRHVEELRRLPAMLSALPQRVVRGFFGTSADGDMATDGFGFHKVIACMTEGGRLVALDAGNPEKVLWSRQACRPSVGDLCQPNVRSVAEGTVFVVEGVRDGFNVTTGESVPSPSGDLDSRPDPSVVYRLRDGELKAFASDGPGTKDSAPLWNFKPTDGQRILSLVSRPVNDPVASIGKVLGDRRVLYKYLDPNLALLVTANDATHVAHFYVLNTVSGTILHSIAHEGVDLAAPVSSIMSENWFAYSYTAETSDSSPKGHQLVVGELFESLVPNDRGPLDHATNFSSLQAGPEPFTLTQTYQVSEPLAKLAVTQTRQGITSRQLLAVLADSKAIVGIPYGVVDPRRPVNRDPTKDEQMEGLIRYSPVVEFDPKWLLNHQRELLGIRDLVTCPALLESTSLVFAYGLDVFGTRLSPSFSFDILGKGFNKFQMLATVAGLAAATFIVAPLVARKQVNTRWLFA